MGWVFTDEMRFYLHDNETLLDGMIRTHHQDVRFECRQGYCGSCRMRVVAKTDDLQYTKAPIAMLEADEILVCCCKTAGSLSVTYQLDNLAQLSLFADNAATPAKNTDSPAQTNSNLNGSALAHDLFAGRVDLNKD
ncbi:2Fe-2S ferredoxin YfaE [Moraxella caviae]|uniref:2Fe-2S iron-sulfur cluster-binding protein n=1 Tax=Moraxella caviae TaxID=34060 RepID=UPI00101B514E|nr:2Fe-2S ferredoxin YfaE [Moraxella caviae]